MKLTITILLVLSAICYMVIVGGCKNIDSAISLSRGLEKQ
jgi:hypothetical protein